MTTRLWGGENIVNTTTAGSQTRPVIAALKDGGYVIAWVDGFGAAANIKYQLFTAFGAASGPERSLPFSGTNTTQAEPSIDVRSDGSFVIGYSELNATSGRDTFEAEFGPNGAFMTTTAINSAAGDTSGAVVSVGSTTFMGYSDGDIRFEFRDVNNNPVGSSGVLNLLAAGTQSDLHADFDGSSGFAVWREGSGSASPGIKLRTFISGSVQAGEVTIASDTTDELFGTRRVEDPHVLSLGLFDAVVAWIETSQDPFPFSSIHAAFVSTSGTPKVTPIQLSQFGSISAASHPSLKLLSDGRIALTYVETNEDFVGFTEFGDIKLQLINADGSLDGPAYTVNSSQLGEVHEPEVTLLADGRIAVTYTTGPDDFGDNGASDGDGSGIAVQIIDPRDGVIDGTGFPQTLVGHESLGDQIRGFGGDDQLFGLGGEDSLYGQDGNDVINGGRGDDTAFGGGGNDSLRGNSGEDLLSGENGNDNLRGNSGDDELNGNAGNDALFGGAGADAMTGGLGNDTASYSDATARVKVALDGSLAALGDAAGDTFIAIENLIGSTFADILRGNSSANSISGLEGGDQLDGAGGADRITGGLGADRLTGGTANDVFVYTSTAEGGDTLTDFASAAPGNNDGFEFKGTAFGGLARGNLLFSQFQSGAETSAQTDNVRFFFCTANQTLFFDADGKQDGQAAIAIATLQAGATVGLGDIIIV